MVSGTYALAVVLAAFQAPSRDSVLAEGIRLSAMEPAAALGRFELLLRADSLDLEASWRAAIARSDLALPLREKRDRPRRDSLLAEAQADARRAVRLAPANVNALFALGMVLGNTALTKGVRDKVRMSNEIRSLALRAVAADSTHDGAQHLLGRWHYEVMRLSGFERFLAKSILGGQEFGTASWSEAQRRLERAVALAPERIYHRLVLARILAARKDTAAAATELERILALPDQVAADTSYRREAAAMLAKLRGAVSGER
jgi:tetratricopeptide (TPR) repeat protein